MAENKIGAKGAKSVSEMLKVNTTLTTLYLRSEEKRNDKGEKRRKNR